MTPDEPRIDALEMRLAEQERTIDEGPIYVRDLARFATVAA